LQSREYPFRLAEEKGTDKENPQPAHLFAPSFLLNASHNSTEAVTMLKPKRKSQAECCHAQPQEEPGVIAYYLLAGKVAVDQQFLKTKMMQRKT
jgi:hypothetical protein